jgi:hypothetical protein
MLLITNDKRQSVPDIIGFKATICHHLHSSAFQATAVLFMVSSRLDWGQQGLSEREIRRAVLAQVGSGR